MFAPMIDTEDKSAWCAKGLAQEYEFIERQDYNGVRFVMNPKKEESPYAHDFVVMAQCDLKTMTTPWRYAQRMFDIPTDYAVSLNEKDLVRYSKLYPNIIVVMDVQYENYKGVHWSDLQRLRKLAHEGKAKRHEYKNRKDDTKGNAKVSWIYDVRMLSTMEKKR